MPLSNCFSPVVVDGAESSKDEEIKQRASTISCSIGSVCDASGSSLVSENGSVVQVAVHGPQNQNQKSNVNEATFECDVRYAPFVACPPYSTIPYDFTKGIALSDTTASSGQSKQSVEKLISEIVREALLGMIRTKCYPGMLISIHATLLESSRNIGQDLAATITASSVALADASIEMLDLVSASTATLQLPAHDKGTPVVSRGIAKGDNGNCSFLTVASRCNSLEAEVAQTWSEGRMNMEGVFSLLREACQMNTSKKALLEHVLFEKLKLQPGAA